MPLVGAQEGTASRWLSQAMQVFKTRHAENRSMRYLNKNFA